MGHGRIEWRATDCDCNGSHVAERGRLRAARIGFTTTYKTSGTAKIAEVAQDIGCCGLDCWLEKLHEFCGNPHFHPGNSFIVRIILRRRFGKPLLERGRQCFGF
jgi:hypothetical protein